VVVTIPAPFTTVTAGIGVVLDTVITILFAVPPPTIVLVD
jgi:hypothetical protein